jgi:chlorobactene glucosyltransferase
VSSVVDPVLRVSTLELWADAARAALPWIVAPLVVWWRARDSRSLDDTPAEPPADPPLVSVVVPARDEARNVERCVRSVLATTYPRVEVVVVDDHSSDGTGEIARALAAGEPRLRVLDNPPLPAGWFGKQWACRTGALAARGDVLLFADADTTHAPDLVGRLVNELRARGGGLLSVVGRQELGSFWERVVQPHVLAVILGRYGGTERVSRARRPVDKIANGQCLALDRATYDAVGGHAAVRDVVVEDLKLAQRVCAAGRPVTLVAGERQLSTRMYTSLAELVRGWRKNVYAGGREAMPLGAFGRLLFPFLLLLPPLMGLVPPLALLAGLTGAVSPHWLRAAAVATASTLLFWIAVYRRSGLSPLYALASPLGSAVLLYISLHAILRGRRVEWRGREYVSAPG